MDWLEYENKNIARGFLNICGVDEAGRGPLAGPVCAAAVILPENTVIEGVNDSKKLSEKKREALFDVIKEQALAYSIARWRTRLKAGVENIKNYTYFNQQAVPEQKSGSIQVLSASLNQDFKLGIFHLDNEVTWQKSSDQTVLPLPDLSLYHNFYMQFKLAKKVLSVQLGADVRYFSKYNAPAYMPAIQNFYLQPENDQVEIGGYPIVNVYANLHLKRTRFYVMMYHVNQGMSSPNYFLSPHYPINPRVLKFGLSWNFYD